MQNWPLLSLLVWLPIVGGAAVLAAGDSRPQLARAIGLVVAIAAFALSLPLYAGFDAGSAQMQFVERVDRGDRLLVPPRC
jgi:NADH-quinone oxidoreductase subunit M